MTRSISVGKRLSTIRRGCVGMAVWVAASLLAGCAQPPPPDNGNTSGDLTGSVSLFSNIRISGAQPVTIVYSASAAATSVSAFYVPVASTDASAAEIGGEVTFATGLSTGTNQAVTLNAGDLVVGIYRVGLNLANAANTLRVLSTGTIQITELPAPVFTQPDQNLAVLAGTQVEIRATLGDPENAVQWRLFYIPANETVSGVSVDQLGTQINTGAANEAIETWLTGGVPLGSYRIGISVTDSGSSIADTVAAGGGDGILTVFNPFTVDIVDQEPAAKPPSVVVSQPSSDQEILAEDTVLIQYSVTVFEGPPSDQTIRVFYDKDGTAGTGDEKTISDNLPISTQGVAQEGSVVFSAALINDDETVFFGVTADDGKNAPVTRYAKGKATRVKPEDAILTVSEPNSPATREPGETVNVAWTLTGLPTSAKATYSVFVRRVDDVGSTGVAAVCTDTFEEICTTGLPLTQLSWTYPTASSGRFRVTVHLVFDDGETDSIEKRAPALVTVSTLPTILWVGDLATKAIPGAVFEGVQFEDNAGSSMAGDEDFDGDGVDDFVIVSRYAKPEFAGNSGIGSGEAYIIRGVNSPDLRYSGIHNLNETGSTALPGATVSGVDPRPREDTDGIASVFITPDADGDGIGELAFGMPWVESQLVGSLGGQSTRSVFCAWNYAREYDAGFDMFFGVIPQFRRGGVVVVSSLNEVLAQTDLDFSGSRIPLEKVGQDFESLRSFTGTVQFDVLLADGTKVGVVSDDYRRVAPEIDEGPLCGDNSPWMLDRYKLDTTAECFGTDPTDIDSGDTVGCKITATGDGEEESFTGPAFGFDFRLADPWDCVFYENLIGVPGSPCEGKFEDCPTCDEDCDPDFNSGDCTCDTTRQFTELPACNRERVLIEAPSSDQTSCDPEGNCEFDADAGQLNCTCANRKDWAVQSLASTAGGRPLANEFELGTGFYVERLPQVPGSEETNWDDVLQSSEGGVKQGQIGCRIIGRNVFDAAGTVITASDSDLIIISPFSEDDSIDAAFLEANPRLSGGGQRTVNGGNAYLTAFSPVGSQDGTTGLPRYWQIPELDVLGRHYDPNDYKQDGVPLRPHQYLAGGLSFDGVGTSTARGGHWDLDSGSFDEEPGSTRIIGHADALIETAAGIPDFNEDGRNDIAIGAPRADVDGNGVVDGAVYIVYRRAVSIEGNYRLERLKLRPDDANRLSGLLVRESNNNERFGVSLAGDFQFNDDNGDGKIDQNDTADLVIGNPDGNDGTGEVIIVFGSQLTVSPENGISVEDEGSQPGLLTRLQGARIRGVQIASEFGLNVANVGDLDGDGMNDLAIAAPGATPMFDSNPGDSNDVLDTPGLDRDFDGVRDDISGPLGVPDLSRSGNSNTDVNDELRHAGLVYIILSSTNAVGFLDSSSGQLDISISKLGTPSLDGFILVGWHGERYVDNTDDDPPVHEGDFLGGGYAGEEGKTVAGLTVEFGGNPAKGPVEIVDANGAPRQMTDGSALVRFRDRGIGFGRAGDVDNDGFDDLLLGSQLADPRIDSFTGSGSRNGGEAYLIYGFKP